MNWKKAIETNEYTHVHVYVYNTCTHVEDNIKRRKVAPVLQVTSYTL